MGRFTSFFLPFAIHLVTLLQSVILGHRCVLLLTKLVSFAGAMRILRTALIVGFSLLAFMLLMHLGKSRCKGPACAEAAATAELMQQARQLLKGEKNVDLEDTELVRVSTNPPFSMLLHARSIDASQTPDIASNSYSVSSVSRFIERYLGREKTRQLVTLDLGANVGFHSMQMASHGHRVRSSSLFVFDCRNRH